MNKHELKELIEDFYDKWQNTDGLWRNDSSPTITEGYNKYSIKISFGQGIRIVSPKNPWMAFLKYSQRVSNGIYPIISIKNDLLDVYMGVSQENNPELDSNFISSLREEIGFKEFDISHIDDLMNYLENILNQFDREMNKYINRIPTVLKSTNSTIKNIILYGSPGVGKTHNTKKLISLIESGKSDKEIFEIIKNNELNNVADIDDIIDRVKFITFHQSFGYEDFIEGFRPNEEGTIKLEKGVFKRICEEAQKNLDESKKDISTLKNEYNLKESLNQFIENFIKKEEKIYLTKSVYINNIDNESFYYSSDSGGMVNAKIPINDLWLCPLNNIQNLNDIKKLDGLSGTSRQRPTYLYELYKLFNKFEQKENNKLIEVQKVEVKDFYLVIDEINRGNISKIFGELITLIEEDKRDTLEVTLPYSKKPFKIPSNLYIIGTMNSTDKSIALIDIALRRRFTFLKMEPNLDLVKNVRARSIMEQLNDKITEALGVDYVLGHSYFMKIENDDDLDFVLEYKVKPLLEEYYYGDNQGLESILEIIK